MGISFLDAAEQILSSLRRKALRYRDELTLQASAKGVETQSQGPAVTLSSAI